MLSPLLALGLALPAFSQGLDGVGRPLRAGVRERLSALEASVPARRLAPIERELLLTVLNAPELDSGPFKDREALARHFLRQGVSISAQPGSDLAELDIFRLVRAARAAAEAFHIPPPVLLCLTFRESSFDPRATAWTTTAKGVGQLTNPAIEETARVLKTDARLRNEVQTYATLLGAVVPDRIVGAPDVDALTREAQRLKAAGAPEELQAAKRRARKAAIASHKDEVGHVFNLETNFGLSAAYLAHLRRKRLAEIVDEEKGWLTAVGAYNQGIGVMNELIYEVFSGPRDYNLQPLDAAFAPDKLARLGVSADRQHELAGEVGSVRRCASR